MAKWCPDHSLRLPCNLCRNVKKNKKKARRGKRFAQGVGTAFGIASAVTTTNVGDLQPGQGGTFDDNWGQSSLNTERDRKSNDVEQGTRNAGNRRRGSSQNG